jgi:Ca-activated chloride channel family protein
VGRIIKQSRLWTVILVAAIASAQEPTFRTDVRLVRLLATVKNAQGQLVGSLERGAFQVLDNGVKQEITVFERQTELPLSVALLIDTSGSTKKELPTEIDSVKNFLTAFVKEGNPDDAISIYEFNWRTTKHTSYTRNIRRLEAALKQLEPEGGTSLYDAMYLASDELGAREGRHVMVIVTDGGDTTSTKDFQAALRSAQEADASVYPVVIVPIKNEAGRNVRGENALTTIALQTGGKTFQIAPGPELDQSFAQILRELRTQYLLGYYPKNVESPENRFHKVEIKLNRTDLRVTSRTGYYEPKQR